MGTHPLHAVGAAWAAKLQKEKICTIAYFGDGATSEGDFHEAMNFAGVFQTPTIFFCQNNQYAISVPRKKQTAVEDHRPEGHRLRVRRESRWTGMISSPFMPPPGKPGKKPLRAEGPTLIEAVTYRFGPHTTADDPTKYREDAEMEEWKALDPMSETAEVSRRERACGTKSLEKKFKAEAEAIDQPGDPGGREPFRPPIRRIFSEYTFAEMTPALKEQMEDYLAFLKEKES